MTAEPVEQRCIRRATSRWSICRCPTCAVAHRRIVKAVNNGYAPRIPWQQGWDAFTGMLDAGWSPAAIASACNLDIDRMHSASTRYRQNKPIRFGHVTCERLLNPGTPTVGYIPTKVACRMTRALARYGWSTQTIAETAGVGIGTVSRIQSGRQKTALADVVNAITGTYVRLSGTVGKCSRAAVRARDEGWAAPYQWVDITDLGERPSGFPWVDAPSGAARASARAAKERAAMAHGC